MRECVCSLENSFIGVGTKVQSVAHLLIKIVAVAVVVVDQVLPCRDTPGDWLAGAQLILNVVQWRLTKVKRPSRLFVIIA